MAEWSQSAFLQALGWATLNSFWQMALLWLVFVVAQHLFRLSSGSKYAAALTGLSLGFGWYIYTFLVYYLQGTSGTLLASRHTLAPTSGTWQLILSSASIAYLLLLIVPAYRLFKNWQYINYLKKHGLEKSSLEYRLFVSKVAGRLGIKRPVQVFISQLINSPVTIGYLKPIILLPVAALNGLTTQQVEAVLLHELSHIKRFDYLINFIINLLQTLFYFNPFIKKFVAAIEAEREKCCDELVLQFEYDKISYASALLTLEKNATSASVLAIGAAGKKHLLNRIEKIVGLEKKPSFSFTHFAGMMTTVLLVIFLNSLFFVHQQTQSSKNLDLASFENPFYAVDYEEVVQVAKATKEKGKPTHSSEVAPHKMMAAKEKASCKNEELIAEVPPPQDDVMEQVIPVAFDEADAIVTPDEKEQIQSTLEATKKVLTTTQWQEVEKSIADGMTEREKKVARHEYLKELEKLDWKNLEKKMKLEFNNMNWNKINANLNQALVDIQLDSLQHVYNEVLIQLEKADAKASAHGTTVLPVPDASVYEVILMKENLRNKIDSINLIRDKKVIRL